MKTLIIGLTLFVSLNAFAAPDPVDECKKFESFKTQQQAHLSVSRYGLGLINATQLKAQQDLQRQQMFAAWAKCEVDGK